MPLELHIWGQAFGLPSIDPECIAIVTYLHHALPSSEWRLIPSNDPAGNPTNHLPALNHDGAWISGFAPIARYLTSKSLCFDLDAGLSASQRADLVAYSAYLRAHAAPLLDLSLYVSAANWATTTRPAYSKLLRWPLTWTIPPLVRAEAIKRAEHLGLAELDSDFDPSGGLHLSAGRDLPETFRRHIPAGMQAKKTVREEMTPEQAAAIRLTSLAERCLMKLDGLLGVTDGEKDRGLYFLKRDSLTSLDCLAFGYLSLMREAPVPRSFLQDCLLEKAPGLSGFVDALSSSIRERGKIPWAELQPSPLGVVYRALHSTIRNMPTLGEFYENELRIRAEQGAKVFNRRTWTMLLTFAATTASLGYALYTHRAMQPFGARLQVWRVKGDGGKLAEFGELGSMLSSAMGGFAPQGMPARSSAPGGSRFVETDTEVD